LQERYGDTFPALLLVGNLPTSFAPATAFFPLKSEALMPKSASVIVVAGRIALGDRDNGPYGGSYRGGSDACGLRTLAARADR